MKINILLPYKEKFDEHKASSVYNSKEQSSIQ